MAKKYIPELNLGRGIAISFVIIAHFINILNMQAIAPQTREASQFVYDYMFTLAMPFFIFISGLVFGLSRPTINSASDYGQFMIKRFKRLMVPYFVYSGLILLPKYFLREFAVRTVNQDLASFLIESLRIILFYPLENPMIVLWFVHTLFIIFLIFPLMDLIARRSHALVACGLALALALLPLTDFLNLKNLVEYLLYFYFGFSFYQHQERNAALIQRYRWPLIALLVAVPSLYCAFFSIEPTAPAVLSLKIAMRLIGITGMYALCLTLTASKGFVRRQLDLIGEYSFDIYLNGHLTQVALRILCVQLLPVPFALQAVLLILGPLYLPIPLSKYFFRRYALPARLFLGLSK